MTNLPVRSGMEDFKKWGDPSNGEGMILKWGRGVDLILNCFIFTHSVWFTTMIHGVNYF